MTTVISQPGVDVITQDEDVAAVVDHALADLGLTFDQLAEQASTRQFESIEARLAWLAIGELYRPQ